jgi:hypothetical protein
VPLRDIAANDRVCGDGRDQHRNGGEQCRHSAEGKRILARRGIGGIAPVLVAPVIVTAAVIGMEAAREREMPPVICSIASAQTKTAMMAPELAAD